jgi:hypothetical protein
MARRRQEEPAVVLLLNEPLAGLVSAQRVDLESTKWLALHLEDGNDRRKMKKKIERQVGKPRTQRFAVSDVTGISVHFDAMGEHSRCENASENTSMTSHTDAQSGELLELAKLRDEIWLGKQLISAH